MTIPQPKPAQSLVVPPDSQQDLLVPRRIRGAKPFDAVRDRLTPRDSRFGIGRLTACGRVQPIHAIDEPRIRSRIGLDEHSAHVGGDAVGQRAHGGRLIRGAGVSEIRCREWRTVGDCHARAETRLAIEVQPDGDQRHAGARCLGTEHDTGCASTQGDEAALRVADPLGENAHRISVREGSIHRAEHLGILGRVHPLVSPSVHRDGSGAGEEWS